MTQKQVRENDIILKELQYDLSFLFFSDKARDNCNFLQIVFNPTDSAEPAGDLASRLGKVNVVQSGNRFSRSKSIFRDLGLSVIPADLLGGRRSLYLVLFDDRHDDSFLACAKIRYHRTVVVK